MSPKLKSFLWSEQTFLAGLLCLVGIFSYQLGQSSVEATDDVVSNQQNTAGIIFTDVAEAPTQTDAVKVVASSGGTKYHKLDCPGANNIKEDNKIYFNSIEQAKAAGYTPAANCEWR
jgi:hypothetical protein